MQVWAEGERQGLKAELSQARDGERKAEERRAHGLEADPPWAKRWESLCHGKWERSWEAELLPELIHLGRGQCR